MKREYTWPAALLALACAVGPAFAGVPQTIVVDGVNDFNPANLIDADGGDTETKNWCTNDPANESPMDLLDIYMTNDSNFLYVGYYYDRDCFQSPQVNLGFALDVNDAAGTTTDPFNRKIAWNNITDKPDYVVYDVMDGFNYEILYETDGAGGWSNISTQVNPSWGGGSNGLGIMEGCPCTGGGTLQFIEFKLPLSVLNSATPSGLHAGDQIHVEWWMTQDGTTKPPLDAACSDGVQTSTPGGTTFDVSTPVEMTCMFPYTILNSNDVIPPTVAGACAVNFTPTGTGQFNLTTGTVDVTFSEPVDLTTSQMTANYTLIGSTISAATRDGSVPSLVHLTLTSPIGALGSFYTLVVSGVKDLAGNTIAGPVLTYFFVQNVVFKGDMAVELCKGIFAPTDTFAVEGNLNPLTFSLCDNALMTDGNADSVYEVTVPFCMMKGGNGKAEADLEWKMSHGCDEFEPLGGNRQLHLSSDNGATVQAAGFWNNDDPVNFTSRPVDVVFQVDASRWGPGTITLLGSQSPLSFNQPGLAMTPIGGNIYRATVRFPKCTAKDVGWKVDYNGVIECFGQGDRSVYLNDAVYDTVGGAGGPITLPARGIDRCSVTDKAVRVVFSVDMTIVAPDPGPPDTVAVMGGRAPLSFTPPPPAAARLLDNGGGYDGTSGDHIFTGAVDFPDSTEFGVDFKYWLNGLFECAGVGDRHFDLNDVTYSVAAPYVRPLNYWDYCSDVTGVPEDGGNRQAPFFGVLHQNHPNPFNPATTISFELLRSGPTRVVVYDVTGRRVALLLDRELTAGSHAVVWNGTDDAGRRVTSGLYFYELAQGGLRTSRRMVVLQ